ncbi:MAG: ATP-binding cassette domain-containing protein [Phormidesmis sp.]
MAAIAAAVVGGFVFYGRVGSLYISIITLALTLVFFNLLLSTSGEQYAIGSAPLGGFNGMQNIPTLFDLGIVGNYLLTLALAVISLGSLLWLRHRWFGRVFNAVRVNVERTELLGYDVRLVQLVGFAWGGAIAGLAGVLHASWGNAISPAVFEVSQAILVITWVIVGGRDRLWGAFLGAGLLHFLSSYLSTFAQRTTPLILGAVLIAMVLLLPAGLAPAIEAAWQSVVSRNRLSATSVSQPTPAAAARLPEPPSSITLASPLPLVNPIRLETQQLSRRFGSFVALDEISLQFEAGKAYCIIGPNGAGKSTYFNLLTGRLQPTAGRVIYNGQAIHRWAPYRRVQAGISIKLQVPNVYAAFSVYENLWLSARPHYSASIAREEAIAAMLTTVNLADRPDALAGELSHGQKQWLEIGMAAIAKPQILLLDEPTGGLSRGETRRTVDLLNSLRGEITIVVIEHDMEFVRQFDAEVTVLAQGQVFRSGRVEAIQQDQAVRAIYLGQSLESPLEQPLEQPSDHAQEQPHA